MRFILKENEKMAKKKNMAAKVKMKAKESFKNIEQNIKKNNKKDMATVTQNTSSKKKRGKVGKIALITIMSMAVLVALAGLSFCIYIIVKAPEFDVTRLYKSSSSIIYDVKGEVIAELGAQKRENVTYDRLPDVLVDAIIATEDAKFFRHSGIDLLRFGKAVAGQLVGQSDAGGGSTLTMQIVKNTYNGTESRGIKGIIRKFTDIYMAVFKVEKTYTKQEIIEFYVNQAFLGSGAYGVSQAASTFFNKDIEDLNLSEAALIAGLFQAPTAYDPYVNPEKAQARRDRVLSLMVRHGYITKEEEAAAKAINVTDMLSGYSYSYSKYQGIVDTVAADVYKKTGYDPYVTSMNVYTTFDLGKQDVIDKIYAGEYKIKWPNDVLQCGIAITDVHTGAVVAIGTGRNKKGEKQFNYATSTNRHPGSTAKPIFDYGPAIEYEGWGTGTMLIDDVYSYTGGVGLHNVDRKYEGIMTAKVALARSRNIPALQAFQATSQENKYEFVTNLGIRPELYNNEILESSSIGAFNGVSPLEMSAAYAAFGRGGYYIEPYTFTKVEYNDSNESYTHTPSRTKVMSEETAFMISDMLKYAVANNIVRAGGAKGDVAGKTGTSSVDQNKINQLNLRNDPINDSWQVVYSPDYSIAYWLGYDTISKEHYLTINGAASLRNSIGNAISPRIITKASYWDQPSGITAVTIERESNMLASEFTPDDLKTTEYYKKGTEPTEVSPRFKQLDDVSNLTYTTMGNQVTLSWTPISTPQAIDETYLREFFEKNYGNNSKWVDKYYNRRLEYNNAHIGSLTYEIFVRNENGNVYSIGTTPSNSFTTSITNASSATFIVKSTYTLYRGNASPGREVSVKVNPSFTPSIPGADDNTDNDDDSDNNGNNNNDNNNNQNDENQAN